MGNHSFMLENLEGRTLFSVLTPMAAAPLSQDGIVINAVPITVRHPLSGAFNVRGTYTHPVGPIGNPDAGSQYDFTGSGKKTSLGKFHMTGHVTGPGFIQNGQSRGRMLITGSRGTITITLVGPPQNPGTLPPSFSYRILKGTGIYAGSTGKGKIAVSASDSTHKFLFRFNPPT